MSETFSCVDPRLVEKLWPKVSNFIKRATVRSNSDYDETYIYEQLKKQNALMWVCWDSKSQRLIGAGTTEICSILETGRILVITSYGGNVPENWQAFLKRLEDFAREEGCDRVRCYGRQGWEKLLRDQGYKQPWIVLEKRV